MGILVIAAYSIRDFAFIFRVARETICRTYLETGGDRLAFSSGIIFLGTVSALLLVVFRGNVDSLIHLYAVGVFLAFSMSDTGMVVHCGRRAARAGK